MQQSSDIVGTIHYKFSQWQTFRSPPSRQLALLQGLVMLPMIENSERFMKIGSDSSINNCPSGDVLLTVSRREGEDGDVPLKKISSGEGDHTIVVDPLTVLRLPEGQVAQAPLLPLEHRVHDVGGDVLGQLLHVLGHLQPQPAMV